MMSIRFTLVTTDGPSSLKAGLRALTLSLGVLIAALMPATTWGQVPTGRMEGTVQDSSGALIPSAKLTVRNERTQTLLRAEADSEGFYVFPSLQPSIYTLTVEARGFKSTIIDSIELNVGINSQVITLEVGQVTESITVAATLSACRPRMPRYSARLLFVISTRCPN